MTKLPLFAAALLLGAQAGLRPEEPSRIFAAGPKDAYYMEPAEPAAKAYARRLLWTGDGSRLVAERVVPASAATPLALGLARETPGYEGMVSLSERVQLVAWSRRTHASETILDLDPTKARLVDFEAMAGSDRLVATLSELYTRDDGTTAWRNAYVLLTGGLGSYTRLWTQSDPNERATFALSPKRPLGQLVRPAPGGTTTVAYFGPDGELGRRLPVPPGAHPFFTSDGSPGMSVRGLTPAGKRTIGFYRFDPQTGQLGDLTTEAGFEAEPTPPLAVAARGDAVRLSVEGGKPEEAGLVTSDGANPVLSPKNDAVAYLSGGGAYVRLLVRLDRKAYEASLVEAAKQRAMVQAKEVGTALSMYAADADDAFPPGGDIPNVVGPYARNGDALHAFVYTYAGGIPEGPLGGIILGYVPGPGGRAVVYGDGHIVWVPDGS